MKLKRKFKYMHLIEGKPAFFCGYQIVFAGRYVEKLCDTLEQIKEEQRKSIEWRKKRDYTVGKFDKYSYVKIVD